MQQQEAELQAPDQGAALQTLRLVAAAALMMMASLQAPQQVPLREVLHQAQENAASLMTVQLQTPDAEHTTAQQKKRPKAALQQGQAIAAVKLLQAAHSAAPLRPVEAAPCAVLLQGAEEPSKMFGEPQRAAHGDGTHLELVREAQAKTSAAGQLR